MRYISDKDPSEFRERLFVATGVVFFVFSVLLVRLWYLQVVKSHYFGELSLNNRIRVTKTPAPRGLILARDGTILAENRPGFDLAIIPEDVEDMEKTLSTLEKLVGVDRKLLRRRIERAGGRPPFKSVKLKEDLSWEEMVRVAIYRFELPGVSIEVGPKRNYPYGEVMAHLIGYVGEITSREQEKLKRAGKNSYSLGDIIGKSGVEALYESVLKGIDGGRQIEVDAHGRLIKVIKEIPPFPGNNLRLTIDVPTQLALWNALRGKAGAGVAIDPRNGKVLAMVSSPSFDPNMLVSGITEEDWQNIINNPFRVFTNRAIQGQYPPASTFKVVTAAAALEEGLIEPSTRMYAGPVFRFAGREYRDWKPAGHGNIDVKEAIIESADTFFYQVGLLVGIEQLARYARMFGFGKKTGIGLSPEKPGLVPTPEWKKRTHGTIWYEGETILTAIGQGFLLTTPLQLANAYSAIANGGTLYVPQLVETIESPNGEVIKRFEPVELGRLNISAETMALLKDALRGVVADEDGTAHHLNIDGLKIAGKTGTAQVVRIKKRIKDIEKIPYKHRDHAWFVGFAPYDDPKIVVSVIVEHGGYGSQSAAPIALEVIKTYLEGLRQEEEEKILSAEHRGGERL